MSVILGLFVLVFIYGAQLAPKGELFADYATLEKSNAVKGIFVLFVFFRHYAQYVTLDSPWDKGFCFVNSALGQMIVVAFLFYSGYGVYCSIDKKGMEYVRSLPIQRALKVWLHYAIAVCLFLAANRFLGRSVSARKFVRTLLCWDAIGNSTWYIMAIILAYLLTYISFRFCIENRQLAILILTILVLIVIVLLIPYFPGRYYNTLLCYPLGVWWAYRKREIDTFLKQKHHYVVILGICAVITALANGRRDAGVLVYELAAVSFVCTGVLLTMKLSFHNKILQYAGNHVFSLYILQRLPMLVLAKSTSLTEKPYLFFVVTFAITFPVSWLFDRVIGVLDGLVFRKKAA